LWNCPGGGIFEHGALAERLDRRALATVSCGGDSGDRVGLDPPGGGDGSAVGHAGVRSRFWKIDEPAIGSSEGRPTRQTATQIQDNQILDFGL